MECNGNIGVTRRCATHPQGRRQGNPGTGKAAVPVSARILACSFLPMSMPVSAFGAGTGTFSDRHPLFLPVVLALCLLAVAVLVGVVAWQYRQIKRKNGFIIRYLYLYLELKYKDNPSLHPKIPERGLSQFEIIETMHLLKKMLCACFLFMAVIPMSAQEGDTQDTENHPFWYIGLQGGVPFGVSTFSSFGADKTRAGFDAGLYGGYRFNPVLSLEAQAAWGLVNQSAQDCCADYWLGADGRRYEAAVAGMNGWRYADLKSGTFTQRYALQLNVNLLGFFPKTKHSRWSLELSPHIAAIGTKSTIQTVSGGTDALKGDTRWHLGAGGNVQAAYRVTRCVSIGIYSGLTYLTGDPMDGMPDYRHDNNFIWESGIRLGFSLGGRKARKPAEILSATPLEPATPVRTECDERVEQPEAALNVEEEPTKTDTTETTDKVSVSSPTEEAAEVSFPVIYFPFDGTEITASELPKARQILAILKENPGMAVTLTGWCDTQGSRAVNGRVSLRRAEALKAWLVAQGIGASRIRTVGRGSDTQAPSAKEARRVVTDSGMN